MKKILYIIGGLIIAAFLVAYSGIPDKYMAKHLSQKFGRNLYTVTSDKISEYNNAFGQNNADRAKVAQNMLALYKDMKPLMTAKAYASLIGNREYVVFIQGCVQHNCTLKFENITLTQRFYDKKENKIGYDYEAKVKIISDSDKKAQTDIAKGYIGLSKENGQWKVYANREFEVPKSIIPSY